MGFCASLAEGVAAPMRAPFEMSPNARRGPLPDVSLLMFHRRTVSLPPLGNARLLGRHRLSRRVHIAEFFSRRERGALAKARVLICGKVKRVRQGQEKDAPRMGSSPPR